jgi:hypothetical protein
MRYCKNPWHYPDEEILRAVSESFPVIVLFTAANETLRLADLPARGNDWCQKNHYRCPQKLH